MGSAHTDAELALLLSAANELLAPGQEALDLGALPTTATRIEDVADWTSTPVPAAEPEPEPEPPQPPPSAVASTGGRPLSVAGGGRVVGTSSLVLWEILGNAYARLGFDVLAL